MTRLSVDGFDDHAGRQSVPASCLRNTQGATIRTCQKGKMKLTPTQGKSWLTWWWPTPQTSVCQKKTGEESMLTDLVMANATNISVSEEDWEESMLTDLVMANATDISVSEEDWGRKHADWLGDGQRHRHQCVRRRLGKKACWLTWWWPTPQTSVCQKKTGEESMLTDLVMANATNISVSEEDWGRKHADWLGDGQRHRHQCVRRRLGKKACWLGREGRTCKDRNPVSGRNRTLSSVLLHLLKAGTLAASGSTRPLVPQGLWFHMASGSTGPLVPQGLWFHGVLPPPPQQEPTKGDNATTRIQIAAKAPPPPPPTSPTTRPNTSPHP